MELKTIFLSTFNNRFECPQGGDDWGTVRRQIGGEIVHQIQDPLAVDSVVSPTLVAVPNYPNAPGPFFHELKTVNVDQQIEMNLDAPNQEMQFLGWNDVDHARRIVFVEEALVDAIRIFRRIPESSPSLQELSMMFSKRSKRTDFTTFQLAFRFAI